MTVQVTRCRSCDAAVVWMKTNRGRNMPVDVDGIDEADLTYEDGKPLFDPEAGHVSHFATCPHAEKHRRR